MSDKTIIGRITNIFHRQPKSRREIVAFLKDATNAELLESNTFSMLEGVLDVQETRVKDVMVPRLQMITIDIQLPLNKIVPIVAKSGHSRFPVTGENKDEVLGILLAKDLLSFVANGGSQNFIIRDILRPAVFIPESKRLNVLLQDFQLNRSHMAIVVDEYGRITGLVTIEDVLEQIVGEIEDEHDIDSTPSIQPQSDGSFIIKGLAPVAEFDEYFSCDLDEGSVETIGGVVMRAMGHLPQRGESIKIGQFNFTVVRADNRRLHLLSMTPLTAPAPQE